MHLFEYVDHGTVRSMFDISHYLRFLIIQPGFSFRLFLFLYRCELWNTLKLDVGINNSQRASRKMYKGSKNINTLFNRTMDLDNTLTTHPTTSTIPLMSILM